MLTKNRVKIALQADKVQIGVLQSIPDAGITEVLGGAGFDFVMADAEHGSLSFRDMEHIARAAEIANMVPLVRVPGILTEDVGRFLDAGAAGIIVPNIRNAKETALAVETVKYPPCGRRGVAMPRASGYGQMGVREFAEFAESQTLVVIEIETKESIENLDEVLSVQGVDVAFMGPLDISAALGVMGEVEHPLVLDARRKIVESCRKAGVVPGTFAFTPEQLKAMVKEGFRFFLMGVDFLYMKQASMEALKMARS